MTDNHLPDFLGERNRGFAKAMAEREFGAVVEYAAMIGGLFDDPSEDDGNACEELANAFDNASQVREAMGDFDEAVQLIRRGMAVRRRLLGDRHLLVAVSYDNLARVYRSQRKEVDAAAAEQAAVEILRDRIDSTNTEMARRVHSGRYEEAMPLATEVRTLTARVNGIKSEAYAAAVNNLAFLYKVLEQYKPAQELYEEAVEVWRSALGEHHEDYAVGLMNLAELHRAAGHSVDAEPILRRALEIFRRLGEENPRLAGALNNLAVLHERRGDYDEAERLHKQAVDIRRKLSGENSPDFAQSLNNLARVYERRDNPAAAETLYEQALWIYRAVLGADHPTTLQTLDNLIQLFEIAGNRTAIDRLMKQMVEKLDRIERDRPFSVSPLPALIPLLEGLVGPELDDGLPSPPTGGVSVTSDWFQESLRSLVRGFCAGEYARCFRMAIRICKEYPCHEVFQIFLIAVQRLAGAFRTDQPNSLQPIAQAALELAEFEPWYRDLMRLTLGMAAEDELLAAARDDAGRCQALFYAANRRLTAGDVDGARTLFNQCQAVEVDLFERRLAARGCEVPGEAGGEMPSREVARLNAEVCRLLEQDRIDAAAEPASRAYELASRDLPDSHRHYRLSLYNHAGVRFKLTDYRTAADLFARLVELERGSPQRDEVALLAALNGLGLACLELGQLKEAEQAIREAVERIRRTGDGLHPSMANVLGSLAEVYRELHDYDAAVPLFTEAIQIVRDKLGEENHEYARQLNNFGIMHLQRGDLESAEPALRRALEIRRQCLGPEHPEVAQGCSTLAGLYLAERRVEEAEELFREAEGINARVFGEGHPRSAVIVNGRAQSRLVAGDLAGAAGLLEAAERLVKEKLGLGHPNRLAILRNLAFVYAISGRLDDALTLLEEFLEQETRLLAEVFAVGSDRQRMVWVRSAAGTQSLLLSVALAIQDRHPERTAVAADWVLRRKGLTADAEGVHGEAVSSGRFPHLRPTFDRLHELRQKRARKAVAGPGVEGSEGHSRLLAEWDQECERLEAELAEQTQGLLNLQQPGRAIREIIAGQLPRGTLLVEYISFSRIDLGLPVATPSRAYAAIVLRGGDPETVDLMDLGDANGLDALIVRFRSELTGELEPPAPRHIGPDPESVTARPNMGDVGDLLRQRLLDPVLTGEPGWSTLVLAPDGELSRLPFDVLPIPDGRRLIDVALVNYVSTARDVLRWRKPAGGLAGAPLVIADPDFDLTRASSPPGLPEPAPPRTIPEVARMSGRRLDRLPGSRREGEQVAGLLGVRPCVGAEATEAKLKGARSPVVLHMATHGFFLEDRRRAEPPPFAGEEFGFLTGETQEHPLLRSGLALAGFNTALKKGALPAHAEDGFLTALDVLGLELTGTQLVVLSACETGLGASSTGEGVFGLRRSFQVAGARTLVMSLWKVPDEQTQELMRLFYGRLLRGEARAEALRQAKLELKAIHAKPVFWGAFICQGDPRALPAAALVASSAE